MRVRIMTWLPALAGFFALTLVADEAAAQCGHRHARSDKREAGRVNGRDRSPHECGQSLRTGLEFIVGASGHWAESSGSAGRISPRR